MGVRHALGCTGHTPEGFCIPAVTTPPRYNGPSKKTVVGSMKCRATVLYDVHDDRLWVYCPDTDWAYALTLPATMSEIQFGGKLHTRQCEGPTRHIEED